MRPVSSNRRSSRGFTLLEMILAMFVLTLLLSGIFAIVGGTTQLASEMEHGHETDAQAHSFAQFCQRTLRTLPAQAQVRLRLAQSGNQYTSELAMKNAPSPLGSTGGNGLTILRTEEQRGGNMRVILESYSAEEAKAHELGKGGDPAQRLVLLENVARCDWRFFNPRSKEWEAVWNEKTSFVFDTPNDLPAALPSQPAAQPPPNTPPETPSALTKTGTGTFFLTSAPRPGLVELTLAIGRAESSRRFVFWVPPAQAPTGVGAAPVPATQQPVDPNQPVVPGQPQPSIKPTGPVPLVR